MMRTPATLMLLAHGANLPLSPQAAMRSLMPDTSHLLSSLAPK